MRVFSRPDRRAAVLAAANSTRPDAGGRSSWNATIAVIQVSRHHQMLVIVRRREPWHTFQVEAAVSKLPG
jgi:hypothetical protein